MKLVQEGEHTALREVSKEVEPELFNSPKLKKIISDMFAVLAKENDGVALAAPQVGLGYRIFVVAPNLSGVSQSAPLVYINPKITKRSKQTKNMEEGCLSVRWLYGEVKRHTQISITAYDEKGVQFKRDASGLLAHIYQHEIEHLDGVLFIDKAKYVTRLDDEAIAKMESQNT